jgi:ankyrin repeat protein
MNTLVMLVVATLALPEGTSEDLLDAVRSRNVEAVSALLDETADAGAAAVDGTTALHWAVQNDDHEIAEMLVAAGADATARNRYGITLLHLAAVNGSAGMIGMLLAAGADPNEAGNEGETALMTASRTGRADAVRTLLDAGAEVDTREDWHGQTALMWAVGQGHAEVARLLVARGADVNAVSARRDWERQNTAEPRQKWLPLGALTPIYFAARDGCAACVPVLVEAGAGVDVQDPEGVTPLVSAIINGHYDVAAELLEHGADPNLADADGRAPLFAAVDFNTMPASNRPAPNVLENEVSSLDLIRMLLARGADVNAQLARQQAFRTKLDRGNDGVLGTGTTPLLRAAKSADLEAMKVLLEHGADPAIATRAGVNPLMAAAGVGTSDSDSTGRYKTEEEINQAIRVLIDTGLDVNATNGRGQTALHGAALMGFDEVVRFLAENGAELDLEDSRGFTPLQVALGEAGGFGFAGTGSEVHESTAALIRELTAAR